MNKAKITTSQQELLDVCKIYFKKFKKYPTDIELAEYFNRTRECMNQKMAVLKRKKLI